MKGSIFKILAMFALMMSITSAGYCVSDSLVISEFSWSFVPNTAGGYDQWIELYNLSDTAIDLTQTSITLQGSSGQSWTDGNAVVITLGSANVNAQTKLIEAHQYFLISNTATITLGETTITPDIFVNSPMLFSKPLASDLPARGIRVLDNEGQVLDAVLYGRHTVAGNPIQTNPEMLNSAGFCDGTDIKNIPTVNIDGIRTYSTGYYIKRKTVADVPVDTDGGSADWEINQTPTPTSSPLTPLNPPSISDFRITNTVNGMELSFVAEYCSTVKVYWKTTKNDPWTEAPTSEIQDLGLNLRSWTDADSSKITTKSRFYKVVAIQ